MLFWLTLVAAAPTPLPDLRAELARQEWRELNTILSNYCQFQPEIAQFVCQEDATTVVRSRIEDWHNTIGADAGLLYLEGLCWRYDNQPNKAKNALSVAVELDPTDVAAWYDLGEVLLSQGDYPGAERAFQEVSELLTTGDKSWLGPWRLAEVAAHQHNPQEFEEHIKTALRRGFSFRQIQGLPNWRAFAADPSMQDAVRKVITVYGTQEVLNSLQP